MLNANCKQVLCQKKHVIGINPVIKPAHLRWHLRSTFDNSHSSSVHCAYAFAPMLEKTVSSEVIIPSFSFEPFYRVILQYSEWESDKPIARKVAQAVPIISGVQAMRITRKCRQTGNAIVVTVKKDDAVLYASNLRNKGLRVIMDEA